MSGHVRNSGEIQHYWGKPVPLLAHTWPSEAPEERALAYPRRVLSDHAWGSDYRLVAYASRDVEDRAGFVFELYHSEGFGAMEPYIEQLERGFRIHLPGAQESRCIARLLSDAAFQLTRGEEGRDG